MQGLPRISIMHIHNLSLELGYAIQLARRRIFASAGLVAIDAAGGNKTTVHTLFSV